MKYQIQQVLIQAFKELGITGIVPEVEISGDPAHGEYTTNVAMRIAAKEKARLPARQGKRKKDKASTPNEIALQVAEEVKSQKSRLRQDYGGQAKVRSGVPDQNTGKRSHSLSPLSPLFPILQAIDHIEVAPPGFINIFVTEGKLSASIDSVLKLKEGYGRKQKGKARLQDGQGTRQKEHLNIVVEFTDPNPFKEFHIGHLYSNTVGESLCRILESQGHTVRRVNYQGDVGMHVAKAIWGMMKQLSNLTPSTPLRTSNQTNVSKLEKKPLPDRVKILGKAYAMGAQAFETDPHAREEMKRLNSLLFVAAQRMHEKEGIPAVVDYRKTLEIDESELENVSYLYAIGRAWSLAYFETLYKRLGTTFDGYYFESIVGEEGTKLVREHVSDGVFEESEGAVVYRGEKHGLHTRVFINQLGLPTYEAKELGLAPAKYADRPYDLSLIVTGNEINEYFKVLLSALGEILPDLKKKTIHIGHGMVRGAGGKKLSSRTGNVLTGDTLIDEVKSYVYDIVQKNKSNYTKDDQEMIAEKAAIAAVKYSFLKVSLPSDIAFDLKESVNMEGDSGPYLQYTYARARSVLRKGGQSSIINHQSSDLSEVRRLKTDSFPFNPEERQIARLLLYFPEIIEEAARNFAPNTLCTYLFNLAQTFNVFYAKHPILRKKEKGESPPAGEAGKKENDTDTLTNQRLALTAGTAQVLKNGLYLLGIETLEQM